MQRADKAAGRDWLYDVAAVVEWREKACADKGRKEGLAAPRMPSATSDDLAFIGDLEPKERVALASQIIKLSMQQRYACSSPVVEDFGPARSAASATPACPSRNCARDMAGFPEKAVTKIRRDAKSRIAAMLEAEASKFAAQMAALTSRAGPPAKLYEADEDEP